MTARLEAALVELADALREEVTAAAAVSAGAPPRLLSVEEAAETTGVGRSLMYRLIGSGEVRSVRIGRRRLVPADALAEMTSRNGEARP